MTIRHALLGPSPTPDEVDEFVAALLGGDEPRHMSLKHNQSTHGKWAAGSETLSAPTDMDFLTPGDRKRVEARMETIAEYGREHGTPGFATTPDAMAAETLKVAGRATPEEIAAGSRWYAEAGGEVSAHGEALGYTSSQACGVTATLSAQRDWDTNLPAAKRVMEVTAADKPFTIDKETYDAIDGPKPPRGPGVYRPSELDPRVAAFCDPAFNSDPNVRSNIAWTSQTASAITILRAPKGQEMSVIDAEVSGPKVRNFYNNLRHPDDPMSVTIDSHQVRVMQPRGVQIATQGGRTVYTSNAPSAFYSKQPGGSVKDPTLKGIGTYPVFAAGMQLATAQYNAANGTNLLPQQLQAITWLVQRREQPRGSED